MPLPRLTWAGLLVASLGWALLLIYPLVAAFAVGPDGAGARDPARFLLVFGENAVMTGFAVALIGVLWKVIDLLGRQAATVHPAKTVAAAAARTQLVQQHYAAQQMQMQASPFPVNPFQSQQAANQFAASQLHAVQQLSPTQLMMSRQTTEVVTRGALSGRDYVLFRDGSVVVETLLGPRRFGSLTEAQEFIGVN